MTTANIPMVPTELSESWATRLVGKIPEFVDVFCLVGVDPETERYVGWGYYESTIEMPGWGAKCKGNVLVLASTRVHLRSRTEDGLKFALKQACDALSRTVWKSQESEYVKFRNKLSADLAFFKAESERSGASLISIERVDSRAFQELLGGARKVNQ